MNSKDTSHLKTIFYFKLSLLFIICLAGFTGPHVWRQIDTLSLSERYFIKFFVEMDFSFASLIPSILNSGESLGFTNSEFPIVAILLSPAFLLGPYYGQVLANVLFLGFCLYLLFEIKNFQKEIFESEDENLIYLIPLVSVGLIYFGRILPDMPSALLFFLGLGLQRSEKHKSIALIVLTISLLLKPTSILLYLLTPINLKKWKRDLWLVIPVVLTVLYYKSMNFYLSTIAPETLRYASDLRTPMANITSLKNNYSYFFHVVIKEYVFPYFPFFLIFFFKWISWKNLKNELLRIVIYTVANVLMLGAHNFIHSYYLFGLSFTASIIILKILKGSPEWLGRLIVIYLVIANSVDVIDRAKPLWRNNLIGRDCLILKDRQNKLPWNQNYVFRSSDQNFPTLGVCFIERVGSLKAKYGFYQGQESIPSSCEQIDREGNIYLVECKESN